MGERVARQVEKRIVLDCNRVGKSPILGAPTDRVDVRRLPIRRYPFTIFYRIIEVDDRIDILRVVHSAAVRDLGKIPDLMPCPDWIPCKCDGRFSIA